MLLNCILVLIATIYVVIGVAILKAMDGVNASAPSLLRLPLAFALGLHIWGLHAGMMQESGEIIFGFAYALSSMMMLATLILLVESIVHRLHGQFGLMLIASAVAVLLPIVFPGTPIASEICTPLFKTHLLLALLAYSFMSIAFLHAILLYVMDKRLKNHAATLETSSLMQSMPAIVVMERIYFRILAVGFVFLSAVLVTGAFAVKEIYGVYWVLDHKLVVTWLSWILFGALLIGRHYFGWRAKKAVRWFCVSFLMLMLAYVGYQFLIEFKDLF